MLGYAWLIGVGVASIVSWGHKGGKEPGEDVVVEEAEVPVEAQDEVEPEEEVRGWEDGCVSCRQGE